MLEKPASSSVGKSLSPVSLVIAVAVIAAWIGIIVYMLGKTGEAEIVWSRLALLLGSVEAVAFAAAGALFGTQIQRQRVQDAHKDAAASKEDAERSRAEAALFREDAVKGRSLAEFAKRQTGGVGLAADDASRNLNAVAELARDLFPG